MTDVAAEYVSARLVLLDALAALHGHLGNLTSSGLRPSFTTPETPT